MKHDMIYHHMQFIYHVIYCTSAWQHFAIIHHTMCNWKLTIHLVLIIFVQFAHIRVLTVDIPSYACHRMVKCATWYVLQTYTLPPKKVHMYTWVWMVYYKLYQCDINKLLLIYISTYWRWLYYLHLADLLT